jgi:phosphoribosylglycinamide formyltransferase-1
VLGIEHRIYPAALRLVASGRTWIEGGVCRTGTQPGLDEVLIVPSLGA